MFGHERDRLLPYVDGALPPRETARVAGHLLRCRGCRQAMERVRKGRHLAQMLSAGPNDTAPVSWGRLAAALPPARSRSSIRPWAMAVATAAALVAAVWPRTLPVGVARAAGLLSPLEVEALAAHRDGKVTIASTDAAVLAGWIAARAGAGVALAPGPDASIEGATQLSTGTIAVHGRVRGEPVTLLVAIAPAASAGPKRIHYRDEAGFKLLSWVQGGRAFALVSSLPGVGERACALCHASASPGAWLGRLAHL